MQAPTARVLTDDQRRRRILALARTYWSTHLKITLPTLGGFFDDQAPDGLLDQREITWDEISQVILEALTSSVPETASLPDTVPLPLSQVLLFASAARGTWIEGYQVVVVPQYDGSTPDEAQGYAVFGIYQNAATRLLGYARTTDAVRPLLASKNIEVAGGWFPCADQEYALVFQHPGRDLLADIQYCRSRIQEGYCVF